MAAVRIPTKAVVEFGVGNEVGVGKGVGGAEGLTVGVGVGREFLVARKTFFSAAVASRQRFLPFNFEQVNTFFPTCPA